jgi:hypothetical protein
MAQTRLASAALALVISLLFAAPALACSKDDTAYFDGFLDTSCIAALNQVEPDVFGGLRLQTNGSAATTSWDTQNDFDTKGLVGTSTLEPAGGADATDPAATLVLKSSPLALVRDLDGADFPSPILSPAVSPDPDNDNVNDPAVLRDGSTS